MLTSIKLNLSFNDLLFREAFTARVWRLELVLEPAAYDRLGRPTITEYKTT
jgi:hypothetical protein